LSSFNFGGSLGALRGVVRALMGVSDAVGAAVALGVLTVLVGTLRALVGV
jgi:hypothetical protein